MAQTAPTSPLWTSSYDHDTDVGTHEQTEDADYKHVLNRYFTHPEQGVVLIDHHGREMSNCFFHLLVKRSNGRYYPLPLVLDGEGDMPPSELEDVRAQVKHWATH